MTTHATEIADLEARLSALRAEAQEEAEAEQAQKARIVRWNWLSDPAGGTDNAEIFGFQHPLDMANFGEQIAALVAIYPDALPALLDEAADAMTGCAPDVDRKATVSTLLAAVCDWAFKTQAMTVHCGRQADELSDTLRPFVLKF